jgi:hypothetical protein
MRDCGHGFPSKRRASGAANIAFLILSLSKDEDRADRRNRAILAPKVPWRQAQDEEVRLRLVSVPEYRNTSNSIVP